MSVEDLIRTMMKEFGQIVKTETVIGEPMVVGETVIVPVSKISFGFGAGGNKGDQRSGTGGGGSVEPVAFIVIRDGKAQLLPLQEGSASFRKLLELAPDVIRKVRSFREKREKRKAEAPVDVDPG